MNPNNLPSSNQNSNSQNPNPQFPYLYPNSYFPNPQNLTFNSQNPNSQYQFQHSQNSQFPFSYPHNSPYQFPFPPFSNPQFETQQIPITIQNSPEMQVPAFGHENIIDLNEDCEETEEIRENIGQWKWVEDKLLISAWLNVSIDPLIGTDQKADAFWDRIHQYCEEDNPGVIKRGVMAMKKRWQRINEGAQKFGSCYDEANKVRKENYFQNIKKANERTLNERLVCYSPVLQLYVVRHAFGTKKILGESSEHAL